MCNHILLPLLLLEVQVATGFSVRQRGVLAVQSSDGSGKSNLRLCTLLIEVVDAVAWAGHTFRQSLPSQGSIESSTS